MKHSGHLVPEYKDAYVFFHNYIEITASRKTENQNKEIRTYLPLEQARRIQATLNFMDKFNVNSFGHASWHVDNNKTDSTCQYCQHCN